MKSILSVLAVSLLFIAGAVFDHDVSEQGPPTPDPEWQAFTGKVLIQTYEKGIVVVLDETTSEGTLDGKAERGYSLQMEQAPSDPLDLTVDDAQVYYEKDRLIVDTPDGLQIHLFLKPNPDSPTEDNSLPMTLRQSESTLSFEGYGLSQRIFTAPLALYDEEGQAIALEVLCEEGLMGCNGLTCWSGGPGSSSCSTTCPNPEDACSTSCTSQYYACCDRAACKCQCCAIGPE